MYLLLVLVYGEAKLLLAIPKVSTVLLAKLHDGLICTCQSCRHQRVPQLLSPHVDTEVKHTFSLNTRVYFI